MYEKVRELTKKAVKNATVTIKPEVTVASGAAPCAPSSSVPGEVTLVVISGVAVAVFVVLRVVVVESVVSFDPPGVTIAVYVVLRVVGTPDESRQTALPAASRLQVVPARQQKVSPGHSINLGSAHPRWVEV